MLIRFMRLVDERLLKKQKPPSAIHEYPMVRAVAPADKVREPAEVQFGEHPTTIVPCGEIAVESSAIREIEDSAIGHCVVTLEGGRRLLCHGASAPDVVRYVRDCLENGRKAS